MPHIITPEQYLEQLGVKTGLARFQLDRLLEELVPADQIDYLNRVVVRVGDQQEVSASDVLSFGEMAPIRFLEASTVRNIEYFRKVSEFLLKQLWESQRVLSLGAQTGLYEAYLALNRPTAEFLATDLVPEFVRETERKKQFFGLKNLDARVEDATHFDVQEVYNSGFDLIYSLDNLHWFDHSSLPMQMKKKLKNNGRLLILNPNQYKPIGDEQIKKEIRAERTARFVETKNVAREVGMGFGQGCFEIPGESLPTYMFWTMFSNI